MADFYLQLLICHKIWECHCRKTDSARRFDTSIFCHHRKKWAGNQTRKYGGNSDVTGHVIIYMAEDTSTLDVKAARSKIEIVDNIHGVDLLHSSIISVICADLSSSVGISRVIFDFLQSQHRGSQTFWFWRILMRKEANKRSVVHVGRLLPSHRSCSILIVQKLYF